MKYEKLFQPGKIGNLELRNRVVMTAMGALMGDWNGCTTPEQIRFYEDRAKGGCGLIIPEFTSVDADSGHCNPIQLGIHKIQRNVVALRELGRVGQVEHDRVDRSRPVPSAWPG